MKILIAPDSFKDALPALQVCEAIRRGALRAMPTAEVRVFPLADGGEGTVAVLAWHLQGQLVETTVHDPLMRPVAAQFLRFKDSAGVEAAYLEMAQASGLERLQSDERNPLITSTLGTGEMVLAAIDSGAKHICLAIGGSATNDAGMGMATALGWLFLDGAGKPVSPTGQNLERVAAIVPPRGTGLPSGVTFTMLCDVKAPLFGPNGAAHVFAPQKGARPAEVVLLDRGLRHFAALVEASWPWAESGAAGAGAAGGLGFGAGAFLKAELVSGADAILQLVGFEEVVRGFDLVLTGEGKLDAQTESGKLIAAVCRAARSASIPVVAICGSVEADASSCSAMGLSGAYQLRERGEGLAAAIARTPIALEAVTYKVLKTIQL